VVLEGGESPITKGFVGGRGEQPPPRVKQGALGQALGKLDLRGTLQACRRVWGSHACQLERGRLGGDEGEAAKRSRSTEDSGIEGLGSL